MADEPGTKKIESIFDWQDIIMTENQEHEWENVTLRSLEAKLRSLPDPEIPQSLKAKLFAATPAGQPGVTPKLQARQWLGAWGFGVTVTAVLILALIIASNQGPSVPTHPLVADINDRTTRNGLADQNTPLIEDTNHVIYNGQQEIPASIHAGTDK